MHGPYLEEFSSGYVMTSLFVEPRNVDVPMTDELFYWNAATELGYSPLVARVGGSTHTQVKSSEKVPDGHIYIPEEMTEDMDSHRLPDQRPILVAKESGANVIYKMIEAKLEEENGNS